jgi:MFS family permease
MSTGGAASARVIALYASGFLWNVCMGALQVLVPLYGLSLGYSIVTISSLVSLPVLIELVVRFGGGAFSDRFGERRTLRICFLLMGLAGTTLLGADRYLLIAVAQSLAFCSRSTFWISIQSLVSQLPGAHHGKKLGRLSAWNYAGGFTGLTLGGVILGLLGFAEAFTAIIALSAMCLVLTFVFPHTEPKPHGRRLVHVAGGIGRFLVQRHIWLAVSVSFAASLPSVMSQSMYPLYLEFIGYRDQWIGALSALRTVGPIAIGFALAGLITMPRRRRIYALGMAGLGLSLIVTGSVQNAAAIGAAIVVAGCAGSFMDLLYQVEATEFSRAGDRTMAMAVSGLGWIICPLVIPMIMGWLAQNYGFSVAFAAAGMLFLSFAAASGVLHRRVDSASAVVAREAGLLS